MSIVEKAAEIGGVLAHWRLGESEGNLADASGNGHTATPSGSLAYGEAGATADGDTAIGFAGSAHATVPDSPDWDLGNVFTIFAFVKRASDGADHTIWGGGTNGQIQVRLDAENWTAIVAKGTATRRFGNKVEADGKFHALVFASAGTATAEKFIYLDGEEVSGGGSAGGFTSPSSTQTIGRNGSGENFDGLIDELIVFDKVLTEEEIHELEEAAGVPARPEASTGEATDIEATKATLHGTVNPNGGATDFSFLYGIPTPFGFEAGDLDGFNTGAKGEGSVTVSEEQASEGSKSAKVVLANGEERVELTLGGDGGASFTPVQLKEGDQFSIEIDYFIPEGEMRYGAPGAHNVIFQLFPADAPEAVPMFNLNLWDAEGDKGLWVGAEDPETESKFERFVGAFPEGQRVRVKLDLRISESKAGHQRVWIDDELVLDEEGVSTVRPDTSYGYCKLGLYRNPSIEGESTIFIDRVVFIGLTEASYGDATEPASAGEGSEPVAVEAVVEGLSPGAPHHFRLIAESGGGVEQGDDATFTTEAAPDVETPRRLTLLGVGR